MREKTKEQRDFEEDIRTILNFPLPDLESAKNDADPKGSFTKTDIAYCLNNQFPDAYPKERLNEIEERCQNFLSIAAQSKTGIVDYAYVTVKQRGGKTKKVRKRGRYVMRKAKPATPPPPPPTPPGIDKLIEKIVKEAVKKALNEYINSLKADTIGHLTCPHCHKDIIIKS